MLLRVPTGRMGVPRVDYSTMEYRTLRTFPVDYVALGFLMEAPRHGYDLRQRIHTALGSMWHVAISQLYQVLHRLEARGWAQSEQETTGGAPPRQVYHATPAGIEAFRAWLQAPVPHLRDMRVEFLAKLYFLRTQPAPPWDCVFAAQRGVLEGILQNLSERKSIATDDPLIGAIALSFRRHQLQSTLAWLDESLPALRAGKELDR